MARFDIAPDRHSESALVIRYQGKVYAYIDRCAHLPYELYCNPGKFSDSEGLVLICSAHGASHDPPTGHCVGGPCNHGCAKLAVEEFDGGVYLAESWIVKERTNG